jgi:hypothetical protein
VADIQAEARIFLLDGAVQDIALYEGDADLGTGVDFVTSFMRMHTGLLPHTVVVDIAFSRTAGWFVLEFNACWGAGLNNCKATKVIDCIIGATMNI